MNKLLTITAAAKMLNVSRDALFAELRAREIIGGNNVAKTQYLRDGYFINQFRGYPKPGLRQPVQYQISLVTPAGMSLLQEIIDAMGPAGRVVVAEREQIPNQQSPSQSATDVCRMATAGVSEIAASLNRRHS